MFIRLSVTELNVKDWKFTRMMRYSSLQFTEVQMLKIVGELGYKGQWRQARSVVEWVYSSKEHRHFKSRFVSGHASSNYMFYSFLTSVS